MKVSLEVSHFNKYFIFSYEIIEVEKLKQPFFTLLASIKA